MKKLTIVCSVVVLILLPLAIVIGCATPTPAPAPVPPPAAAPAPPAPSPPPVPAKQEFPLHKISYQNGLLKYSDGREVAVELQPMDWDVSPSQVELQNLRLREGFVLQQAVLGMIGLDVIRHVVAVHEASATGFVVDPLYTVEPLDDVHGKFLFAPIESTAAALEYVKFMIHEPHSSLYERDHIFIHSTEEFDQAMSEMKEFGDGTYETIGTPPTNTSKVTEQSLGNYLVELVYMSVSDQVRIEYFACQVYSEGSLEFSDCYIFILGGIGLTF